MFSLLLELNREQKIRTYLYQYIDWCLVVSVVQWDVLLINDTASTRARSVGRTSGLVARWDAIIMFWWRGKLHLKLG